MFITLFSSQPPELFIFKHFTLEPHDSGNKLFVASFDTDLFQPICLQISTSDQKHGDKAMRKLPKILLLLKPQ